MKTIKASLMAAAMATLLGGAASGNDQSNRTNADAKVRHETNPAKMTCEDFLAVEDVQRPKLVYWAEGYNNKGKADDAYFDVQSTDRLIPMIVESCQSNPKASFVNQAKEQPQQMKQQPQH